MIVEIRAGAGAPQLLPPFVRYGYFGQTVSPPASTAAIDASSTRARVIAGFRMVHLLSRIATGCGYERRRSDGPGTLTSRLSAGP